MSLSINDSACLVIVNERFAQTRSTCRELFRPYSYSQQRDIFCPIAVGVCRIDLFSIDDWYIYQAYYGVDGIFPR